MNRIDDIEFVTFELEADAWDYLYEHGFTARLTNHREFDHADGTWAILIPGDDADAETEVKLFRRSGPT